MEAYIGRDRGQEPSNREYPDHIGAVGTYAYRFQIKPYSSVSAMPAGILRQAGLFPQVDMFSYLSSQLHWMKRYIFISSGNMRKYVPATVK